MPFPSCPSTTLLHPVAYPTEALADLCLQPWRVELHFREVKTLMRLDVLRCSPQMIRKELLMHLIAYNLVRSVMLQAAPSHDVELSRLSCKDTLHAVQAFAAVLPGAGLTIRQQAALEREPLGLIALDQLPQRPARVEPRAKKRLPKHYPLLTKPRHKLVLTQRRSRHKASTERHWDPSLFLGKCQCCTRDCNPSRSQAREEIGRFQVAAHAKKPC